MIRPFVITAIVGLFVLPVSALQRARAVTVSVTTPTETSGTRDVASSARQRAVTDIVTRLRKNQALEIVAAPADALIRIVVTSLATEPTWQPRPLGPALPLEPGAPLPRNAKRLPVARATLEHGTDHTFFAEAEGVGHVTAAENLARSIEEWFEENSSVLGTLR
jgi:hypothetical protein